MNLAQKMVDIVNATDKEKIEKNQDLVEHLFNYSIKRIESEAKNSKRKIEWLTLCMDADAGAVNLEVCRRLEANGFTISKNHSLRDFAWERRSGVTITW